MGQKREQLVAANREKFQAVAKAPEDFSTLQISSYLRSVALRREINAVQKAAASLAAVDGVPVSKIASQTNREFIFSSSQGSEGSLGMSEPLQSNLLTFVKPVPEKAKRAKMEPINSHLPHLEPPAILLHAFSSMQRTEIEEGKAEEAGGNSKGNEGVEEDVQAEKGEEEKEYTESRSKAVEKGDGKGLELLEPVRKREEGEEEEGQVVVQEGSGKGPVSRFRGMGVRMTRDLQWNLYLMKDREEEESRKKKEQEEEEAGKGLRVEILLDGKGGENDEGMELFRGVFKGEDASIEDENEAGEDDELEWEDGNEDEKVEWEDGKEDENVEWEDGKEDENVEWEDGKETAAGRLEKVVEIGGGKEEKDVERKEDLGVGMAERQVGSEENVAKEEEIVEGGEVEMDKKSEFVKDREATEEEREAEEQMDVREGIVQSDELSTATIDSSEIHTTEEPNVKNSTHGNTFVDNKQIDKLSEDAMLELAIIQSLNEQNNKEGRNKVLQNERKTGKFSSNVEVRMPQITELSDEEEDGDDNALPMEKMSKLSPEGNSQEEVFREVDDNEVAEERARLARERDELEAELAKEKEEMEMEDPIPMADQWSALQEEKEVLLSKQRRNERNAETVTSEMFAECQELLQMFGIPYIVAPMEAEAQCAFLNTIGAVDAVVTDDCDVFLFGASNVFKNLFDERRYVEVYAMADVEGELGLTRGKLVNMALLLGSDYTEGISGIGIVNAIEVVNAYPTKESLTEFRDWLRAPDDKLVERVEAEATGQRKKRKLGKNGEESGATGEREGKEDRRDLEEEGSELDRKRKVFQTNHIGARKNWNIPESFPSEAVIQAYLKPQVDESTESFTWGRPDLDALRMFCKVKLGFPKEKADEALLPALKAFDTRQTQLRLDAFYTFNQRFAKIRSKRIQKAITGITGKRNAEIMDGVSETMSLEKKKRGTGKKGNQVPKNSENGNELSTVMEEMPQKSPETADSHLNEGAAGEGEKTQKPKRRRKEKSAKQVAVDSETRPKSRKVVNRGKKPKDIVCEDNVNVPSDVLNGGTRRKSQRQRAEVVYNISSDKSQSEESSHSERFHPPNDDEEASEHLEAESHPQRFASEDATLPQTQIPELSFAFPLLTFSGEQKSEVERSQKELASRIGGGFCSEEDNDGNCLDKGISASEKGQRAMEEELLGIAEEKESNGSEIADAQNQMQSSNNSQVAQEFAERLDANVLGKEMEINGNANSDFPPGKLKAAPMMFKRKKKR